MAGRSQNQLSRRSDLKPVERPTRSHRRRLVDGEPITSDLGDDIIEFLGVGWLDDIAIDPELVALNDFDRHLGRGENNNRNTLGARIRFQLAEHVKAADFVENEIEEDEPGQRSWFSGAEVDRSDVIEGFRAVADVLDLMGEATVLERAQG